MSDLTDFLLARIAEDEAVARAANGPRWASGDGSVSEGGLYALDGDTEDGWSIAWFDLGTANEGKDGERKLPRWPKTTRHAHENSVHAARHDPARVLAECEAKRRVVEEHPLVADASRLVAVSSSPGPGVACETCGGNPMDSASPLEDIGPCDTLLALAAVYADHPDYREEWRP